MAKRTSKSVDVDQIQQQFYELNGREFEYFVAALWTLQEWETTVTDQQNDGGVDVVATKEHPFKNTLHIEVKNWEEQSVSSPTVRKYALNPGSDADIAVLVSSGEVTAGATNTAAETRTKLIDGEAISELVLEVEAEKLVERYVEAKDVTAVEIEAHVPYSLPDHLDSPRQSELASGISGIDADAAEELAAHDIESTEALATVDAQKIASATDIEKSQLERWSAFATYQIDKQVDALDGIGDKFADNLSAVGVDSVADLARASLSDVKTAFNITEEESARKRRRKAVERPAAPVIEVDYIGETKAEQLRDAGVETVGEFYVADAESLAEELDGFSQAFIEERQSEM